MIELAARVLMDLGMTRGRSIALVGTAGVLFGIPSALNLDFFHNQDWVWGVGLMLSGFFFAFAVLRYGVSKWRETFINHAGSDLRIGAWWDWVLRFIVVESIVLMGWWLWSAKGSSARATWTLFSSGNVGTVLIQWGVVLVVLILANGRMARSLKGGVGQPEDG
jgi:NSS family neurotransmitter:Na+ symporter